MLFPLPGRPFIPIFSYGNLTHSSKSSFIGTISFHGFFLHLSNLKGYFSLLNPRTLCTDLKALNLLPQVWIICMYVSSFCTVYV